jgi:excinuclease ABC subunit A
VRGARNLKNIDLDLPKHALVVITGLSGSGKSSLAFDTLYAEGQRRYVESLSAYARQFLQLMDKPDVDVIEGLSPAISIEQKATSHNPRSTVGTVTEIHDYLRLLYARAGTPFCPDHGQPLQAQSVSQMVDAVLALPEGTKLMVLAPVVRDRKGEFTELFQDMQAQGYVRFRVDGVIVEALNLPTLKKAEKHDIDVVIDRLKTGEGMKQRLAESFEAALRIADGRAIGYEMDTGAEHLFSAKFACPICSYSLPELEPRLFSFNSPVGACPHCDGLGVQTLFDPERVVAFPAWRWARAPSRAGTAATPTLLAAGERGRALRRGRRAALRGTARGLPPRGALRLGRGGDRLHLRGRGPGRQDAQRQAQPPLRRHHPQLRAALPRDRFGRRARGPGPLPERQALPALRWRPAAARGPQRLPARHRGRARAAHLRGGAHDPGRGPGLVRAPGAGGAKAEIADKVVREIRSRLKFLNDVGLNYLSLDRSADTLSGGEAQRIRLASQIGSGLTGVMYVLDEPSIGLHQRDNDRLIGT